VILDTQPPRKTGLRPHRHQQHHRTGAPGQL